MAKSQSNETDFSDWVNSVLLVGRVSSESEEINLPSGETLIRFRIVIPREITSRQAPSRATVDTIDCVTFKPVVQKKVRTLQVGTIVELEGQIRRRFWKAGAGVASRVEVEVVTIKRMA